MDNMKEPDNFGSQNLARIWGILVTPGWDREGKPRLTLQSIRQLRNLVRQVNDEMLALQRQPEGE